MNEDKKHLEELEHIRKAPEAHLAAAILSICAHERDIRRKMVMKLENLAKLDPDSEGPIPMRSPEGLADLPGVIGKRRSRGDVHVCTQCLQAYTDDQNGDTACSYHDGELEGKEDLWVDVYEGDPDPDTEEMREDCPEFFFWDCCNADGDSEGCKRGRHNPVSGKRGRSYPGGKIPSPPRAAAASTDGPEAKRARVQ